MTTTPGSIKVALFSGGRGASTIARELSRRPGVRLTLLINAYDDGLSTGALRGLVPGMLGASDFRKNMSNLMDLHSSAQYELRTLLEHRFPEATVASDIEDLRRYLRDEKLGPSLSPFLKLFAELDSDTRLAVCNYTRRFLAYQDTLNTPFDFNDCSFGNIIFAGAYLECDADFNRSIKALAALFGSSVRIVNVTQGESRTLAAIKEDGEVLFNEAAVVSEQSPTKITDLFLLEDPISLNDQQLILAMMPEQRRDFLNSRSRPVHICAEADEVLREADIVIYGCGTQHSSLLPSYLTVGLPQAIQEGCSKARILLSNLQPDHDIQGWSAGDIVNATLQALSDPDNTASSITHLFYAHPAVERSLPLGQIRVKNLQVIQDAFANPLKPGVHSGYTTASRALDLLESKGGGLPSLDIYVDLHSRSGGAASLEQEFLELPWQENFSKVRLRLNSPSQLSNSTRLPSNLSIEGVSFQGLFSDVPAVREWLENEETADYLLTLTGDGEYALRDVFLAHRVMRNSAFGAVFGSRNQSRRQFRSSLLSAYGESPALYWVSWLGAYFLSVVFGLLFRVVFSDPMTGFRLYRRDSFHPSLREAILRARLPAASSLVRHLRRGGVEIAEIPIRYRTFKGFTRSQWRLLRGFRNLLGSLI